MFDAQDTMLHFAVVHLRANKIQTNGAQSTKNSASDGRDESQPTLLGSEHDQHLENVWHADEPLEEYAKVQTQVERDSDHNGLSEEHHDGLDDGQVCGGLQGAARGCWVEVRRNTLASGSVAEDLARIRFTHAETEEERGGRNDDGDVLGEAPALCNNHGAAEYRACCRSC